MNPIFEKYLNDIKKSEYLSEYQIKRVVRNGKIKKKKVCPKNFKWSEKEQRCKIMSSLEIINRRRSQRKASTIYKRKSKKNRSNLKRKKSMRVRKNMNL